MERRELNYLCSLLNRYVAPQFAYVVRGGGLHDCSGSEPLTVEEIVSHLECTIEGMEGWIAEAKGFLDRVKPKESLARYQVRFKDHKDPEWRETKVCDNWKQADKWFESLASKWDLVKMWEVGGGSDMPLKEKYAKIERIDRVNVPGQNFRCDICKEKMDWYWCVKFEGEYERFYCERCMAKRLVGGEEDA